MGERRCGYCREFNHNSRMCLKRLGVIKNVREHIGSQRLDLVKALIANGFGVGAIVKARSYYTSEDVPCLITQESLDSITRNNFIEYYNVKYTKRVKARLVSLTGVNPMTEDEVYTIYRAVLSIKVMPMITGPTEVYANIHVSDLGDVCRNNPHSLKSKESSWAYISELLAPSNDGIVDMEQLGMKFMLHERLDSNRLTSPIFPFSPST